MKLHTVEKIQDYTKKERKYCIMKDMGERCGSSAWALPVIVTDDCVVCEEFNRNYILIDKEETNNQLIKKSVEEKRKETNLTQKTLFGDGM